MGTFFIVQQQIDSEIIEFQIQGTLAREAAPILSAGLDKIIKGQSSVLVIDFSKMDHITGDGLHLLSVFCTQTRKKGYKIRFSGLNDEFRRIFKLTRLDTITEDFQLQSMEKSNLSTPGFDIGSKSQFWSQSIETVSLPSAAHQGVNLNVHGRALTSPVDSFGSMWLRTYRTIVGDAHSPEQVMAEWKDRFSAFWPSGNHIYMSTDHIVPGTICLINLLMPMGVLLSTGAVVIYSDATSFTLVTVQGHMFSGFITFSVYRENNCMYAQTQALVRPNDLFYEGSFWAGFGTKAEDNFWLATMKNITTHFAPGDDLRCPVDSNRMPETSSILIDRHIGWRHFWNVWYNAAIRSGMHQLVDSGHRFAAKREKNKSVSY